MITSTVPVRWKLRQYLNSINVTPYALAKTVGMPMASMYRLLANPNPKQIDNDRLGQFLNALHEMGHETKLTDLLEYTRD